MKVKNIVKMLTTKESGSHEVTAPQELLKEYVQSRYFTSAADIMAAMKEMFRDVIQ